jgi:alpha-glucosidase
MRSVPLNTFIIAILLIPGWIFSEEHSLTSPDGRIAIQVTVDDHIHWAAACNDISLIERCRVALTLENGKVFGKNPVLLNTSLDSFHREIKPVVPNKSAVIEDKFNQLILEFEESYSLVFRAYNDGAAYRFRTRMPGNIAVYHEQLRLHFPVDYKAWFPGEENLISHYERSYLEKNLTGILDTEFASLPILLQTHDSGYLLITEADLFDYPCLFLSGTGGRSLNGMHPEVVLETQPLESRPDRSEVISRTADYIALTEGTRDFPWRVFIIAEKAETLVESNMVFQLSRPLELQDTQWINPGKVAWDWWNALNTFGVEFESGINTETYKYYIDFASEFGLEYIILDEGWSKTTTDVTHPNSDINIGELTAYGREKNVGVILWILWKPLDKDMDNILSLYEHWGIKGIKVDFMQRADQDMVNFYHRTVKQAAEHHLLVDFHGAFKPAGLRRAYPNLLTYEGVKGLEHSKWSKDITPKHDVTLPFIRMAAGPMDYTPGAMHNTQDTNFRIRYSRPMSQGTRCHQIALYVVYESPLQMLCDSPSNYYNGRETTQFISRIPVVWDETIVLEAAVSEYIVVARRRSETWYIGALTNWTPREFDISLSFLRDGVYAAEIMQDGINAAEHAEDFKKTEETVSAGSMIKIKMAPGGGWAAILTSQPAGAAGPRVACGVTGIANSQK